MIKYQQLRPAVCFADAPRQVLGLLKEKESMTTTAVTPAPSVDTDAALRDLLADQMSCGQLYLRDRPKARKLVMEDDTTGDGPVHYTATTTVSRSTVSSFVRVKIQLSAPDGSPLGTSPKVAMQHRLVGQLKVLGWAIDNLTCLGHEWTFRIPKHPMASAL